MVSAAFNVFAQPSRDRGVTCRHPWTIIFRFFSSTWLPAASSGESNKEQTPSTRDTERANHQRARESQNESASHRAQNKPNQQHPFEPPTPPQCLTVRPDQQPTTQQPPKEERKERRSNQKSFSFGVLRAPKERKPSNSAAVRTHHCAEPATTAVEIIATSTFGRSAGSALGPSAADFSGATPSHDPSDWQNWWEEYLNENDATDKDDGMGNYDREVPWRVMQPRHAMTNSGLCNPSYFNGSAFTGIHDANITGDRRSGVSGVYGGADTNSSTYYTDDRPGSAKRQRLASVTRPAELTTMKAPTPDGDVGTVSAVGGARPGSSRYTSGTAPTLPPYIYPPPDKFGSNQRTTQGFSTGEWFPQRSIPPSTSSSSITAPFVPLESAPSPATRSSIASPTTMFGMEPLITDYESGFYSLWNGTNGANVMGYEADTDRAQLEGNQVYMPEEELKMEYAQLSDLNQGDLDYIYGTMDSGPSPSSASMRDAQPDRLFPAGDRLKRERSSEDKALTSNFQAPPGSSASFPSGGFRSLARNANIEVKRSAQQPHPYQPTSNTSNQPSSSTTEVPTGTAAGNTGARRPGSTVAKRPRSRQCDFPGCTNRARSHQKCKKHGGAHQCVFEGCTKNSQSRGLCIAHGGGSRCKVEGCTRASQSKGLCKSHGGGEYCAVEGCRKKAHLKHLCRTHGGGVRCKNAKCMKWAQRKGWCMAHAKEMLGS